MKWDQKIYKNDTSLCIMLQQSNKVFANFEKFIEKCISFISVSRHKNQEKK